MTRVNILTHVCYQTNITDDRTAASPKIFSLALVIFGKKLSELMHSKTMLYLFLSSSCWFLVYLRSRNRGEKELMRTYDSGFKPFKTNATIFIPPIRKQKVF